MLDSFPVSVCDNIRIRCRRIISGENYRGFLASKRRYFYGVRGQVITTADGIPVEFAVLPGKFADLEGLAHLALELPREAHSIADPAYTNYEWEDYLLKEERINFLVQRKSKTRRAVEPFAEDCKKLFRKRIETALRSSPSISFALVYELYLSKILFVIKFLVSFNIPDFLNESNILQKQFHKYPGDLRTQLLDQNQVAKQTEIFMYVPNKKALLSQK